MWKRDVKQTVSYQITQHGFSFGVLRVTGSPQNLWSRNTAASTDSQFAPICQGRLWWIYASKQIPSLTFVDLWWISLLILFLSTATDKVALLIGNMNYIYHTQLCAPISDVHELTNLLRQLDFKVVSLLDLNWQEMHSAVTEFLLLLDKGVYGTSAAYICPLWATVRRFTDKINAALCL